MSTMSMKTKSYYNSILSQTFSPCGVYLAVGDIYGCISVFNLQNIVSPDETADIIDKKPRNKFEVGKDIQINSLLTTELYLLVGTVGEINVYNWKQVINSKDLHPTAMIDLLKPINSLERADVNCMISNSEEGIVYAGCSDTSIYVIKIEIGKVLHALNGHNDYIHCIKQLGNNIISGGEDGIVNIWDERLKNVVHKLEPHKNTKLQRAELGKWIGAVDLNEDWLLCGGGPRLSLWHYRSLNVANIFPINDSGIHVGAFYEDKIFAGGQSKNFYHMNLNGDMVSIIPTSSASIFSAVMQDKPLKVLCLSGSSQYVDICTNFNYRDQVLSVSCVV